MEWHASCFTPSGGFCRQGRRGSLKGATLLFSLCGIGAFLLLAGHFPGLPAQAAPHASEASLCCDAPVSSALSGDHSDVGRAADMDDEDGDDGDRADLSAPQGPILECAGTPAVMGWHSARESWSIDVLEAPHSRSAHGYNLRRRILKKTR